MAVFAREDVGRVLGRTSRRIVLLKTAPVIRLVATCQRGAKREQRQENGRSGFHENSWHFNDAARATGL